VCHADANWVCMLPELLLSSTTTAKKLQWDIITMLLVLQNKCNSPIRISRQNISLVNVVEGGGKDGVLFDHYQAPPNPVPRVCRVAKRLAACASVRLAPPTPVEVRG